jgi:hypothetical protein
MVWAAMIAAMMMMGCRDDSLPATLQIVAPADGAVVCGDPLEVTFEVQNFDLTPDLSGGHIDVALNGQAAAMVGATTLTIDMVKPGEYRLDAYLANADHTPVAPFAGDFVFIIVEACAAPPVPSDESNRDGVCAFNRECPADQRCECVDGDCACRTGARGVGANGVDTCVDGNDCASSLCVEGLEGAYYCSDECETDADCGPNLPQCLDVAWLGRVCTRR